MGVKLMYKYFKDREFACKCGCGLNNQRPEHIQKLDKARTKAKVPFKVTRGCSCVEHNAKVGGSPTSSHLKGCATDIAFANSRECFLIVASLIEAGFNRIGISKNGHFIHVDDDKNKSGQVIWLY